MYIRRGHQVEVECSPDKAPLFMAAGASVVPQADNPHHWLHAPAPGAPLQTDDYAGNKGGWNLSQHPMPQIGGYWELWQEYASVRLNLDAFVTDEVRASVDAFVAGLPRPLVLLHTRGNTGTESKNLTTEQENALYRGLVDRTDATLVLLDWDDRVSKLNSYRVRHLGDDWRHLSIPELYRLIQLADLLVGIDSGPLHFARFTDTPAVGVWTHHFPSHYALPRKNTLHVVPHKWREWTQKRRATWNIVECPSERIDGAFLAEVAAGMLEAPRYLPVGSEAQDACLRQWVGYCRQFDSPLTSFVDRHKSFDQMLRHAAKYDAPRIVETGCIRSVDDWSAGFSTYLFGALLAGKGAGQLHSVDLSKANVAFAAEWTTPFRQWVSVHERHSHDWLREYSGAPIDLLYLDSADVGTEGYQECALDEFKLAQMFLHDDSLVVFDDSCWSHGKFQGKGAIAIPYMLANGWRVTYAGYQVLLKRNRV